MRKVVASEYLSLDGVAEQPNEFVLVTDFDDLMDEDFRRIISTQDTVLLGRRTYDDWAAFWPTSDVEPFASFINEVEKFVVTSTPLAQSWSHATVIDGDLFEIRHRPEAAARQRHRSGREHHSCSVLIGGGPSRRITTRHRPGRTNKWTQTLRQGSSHAAQTDPPRGVSSGLPPA